MSEQRPAANILHAMLGNVKSNKLRRPYVSIVQIAGHAKMKLISPNPKEAILGKVSVNIETKLDFASCSST